MSEQLIRKAFESRLKTWADAQTPAIPIAWQNLKFTPPGGRYVEAAMLLAPVQTTSLDGVCKAWRGVFQVVFCLPVNIGSSTAESLIASLRTAFPVYFDQDTIRVFRLSEFSAAPSITRSDRYSVPASCQFRVDTAT